MKRFLLDLVTSIVVSTISSGIVLMLAYYILIK
jgi:hypothetical protein